MILFDTILTDPIVFAKLISLFYLESLIKLRTQKLSLTIKKKLIFNDILKYFKAFFNSVILHVRTINNSTDFYKGVAIRVFKIGFKINVKS